MLVCASNLSIPLGRLPVCYMNMTLRLLCVCVYGLDVDLELELSKWAPLFLTYEE